MDAVTETRTVAIGNSRGLRLPKHLRDKYRLDEGDLQLIEKPEGLLIQPKRLAHPRAGWDEQIRDVLAAHGDDNEKFWPDDMQNDFDEEWTWPIDYNAPVKK